MVHRGRAADGTRPPGLLLNLALEYEIVQRPGRPRSERYKVSTKRYQHHLFDADGREILLFHWHPSTGQAPPHLHVSNPAPGNPYTRRAHVPTGRVTVEAIVRFVLTELGAVPGRPDWLTVLDECDVTFDRFKTW